MWNIKVELCKEMELYEISAKMREETLKLFAINEEILTKLIRDIQQWIDEEQSDLPKESKDREFIELILLKNKFQMDRTKSKVKSYFKILENYQDDFRDLGGFKLSKSSLTPLAMPQLTPSMERVSVMKLNEKLKIKFDVKQCCHTFFTLGVINFHCDKAPTNRFVFDFKGFSFLHLIKITPSIAWKLYSIYDKMLTIRIAGIELINTPYFLGAILTMIKSLLSPKLISKIYVHDSLDSLYENIPKACLPSDYGGDLEPLETMTKKFDKIIEVQTPLYEKFDEMINNFES